MQKKHKLIVTKNIYKVGPVEVDVENKTTGNIEKKVRYRRAFVSKEVFEEEFFSIYNLENRKAELEFHNNEKTVYEFEVKKAA